MTFLYKLYQRFTWLSLDVVLGAMAGMLFFAKLCHVALNWQAYAILGLAVWCVYTLDHLLDAQKANSIEEQDRHHFHLVYHKVLTALLIFAAFTGLIWAVLFFGFDTKLYLGIGLALIIMLVLLLVRKYAANQTTIKELSSAVFYVVGISWLPLVSTSTEDYSWITLALTFAYMGLAYLNLIMLSSLDEEKDKRAGFTSIATKLPHEKLSRQIRRLAWVLIVGIAFILVLVSSIYRVFPALLLLMLLMHYLSFFSTKLAPLQIRKRMELTFAIPLILLLLK